MQVLGEPLAASEEAHRAEWIASFEKTGEAPEKGPFYWVHHESGCVGIADNSDELDDVLAEGADAVPEDIYLKWKAEFEGDEL